MNIVLNIATVPSIAYVNYIKMSERRERFEMNIMNSDYVDYFSKKNKHSMSLIACCGTLEASKMMLDQILPILVVLRMN